jgi:hypothetical protein
MLANSTGPAAKGSDIPLVSSLRTPLLWTAGIVIVFTVVFGDLPGEGKYSGVLQDSCHAPAFAVLAFIFLSLLARRRQRSDTDASAHINLSARALLAQGALTVGAMCLLGCATELLQGLLGRDAELDDVMSDVAGSLGATGVWSYLQLRSAGRAARTGRILAVLLCVAMFAYWVAPLLKCASAYWHRNAQFPVLAEFHSPRDLYFLDRGGLDTRLVAGAPDARPGVPSEALQVTLGAGRWPGIALLEPVPDWRGYHALALALENPGAAALTLHLRVNDHQHDGTFDDRFNTSLVLPPHARTIYKFQLQQLESAPRTRRMDLRRIATLILFHDGGAPGQVFLVQRVWLE